MTKKHRVDQTVRQLPVKWALHDEDRRTVIEADFDTPIGYIGGRDGKRDNHLPARRLRLVVDDTDVITAFPF